MCPTSEKTKTTGAGRPCELYVPQCPRASDGLGCSYNWTNQQLISTLYQRQKHVLYVTWP